MIEEIIKLRRNGLSFRKIALELGSTVGRVQYQWKKYIHEERKGLRTGIVSRPEQIDVRAGNGFSGLGDSAPLTTQDELVLWSVSADKVYAFWRLSRFIKNLVQQYFDQDYHDLSTVLRLYDITSIIFNGHNAHGHHEIMIAEDVQNWTFKGLKPNRSYCIELGVKLSGTKFFPLLRSNSIHMTRTSAQQSGKLLKDITTFMEKYDSPPNWIEHVSTYSYYEKTIRKEERE
ncbi:DUF4912 domain-containing protein [Bacillus sp. V33-4]|uniref:DUF4912 domain-containing protein n=1 Tax=Bacillus sp. V33-4 TaxID=2054169 RepID=UPI000C757706|nr:DUF4912 domain-containing protein [Bacillus sp. V33-4]PLR87594.1 DUF4912 domain-containing protein [Bacillus sp. V33-4]